MYRERERECVCVYVCMHINVRMYTIYIYIYICTLSDLHVWSFAAFICSIHLYHVCIFLFKLSRLVIWWIHSSIHGNALADIYFLISFISTFLFIHYVIFLMSTWRSYLHQSCLGYILLGWTAMTSTIHHPQPWHLNQVSQSMGWSFAQTKDRNSCPHPTKVPSVVSSAAVRYAVGWLKSANSSTKTTMGWWNHCC